MVMLMAVTVEGSLVAQEPLTFKASRDTIEVGQSTTLSWDAPGDSAFLVGVGKVRPSGEQIASPLVPTTYVLVVEAGDSVRTAALTIDVTGSRGASDFPDIGDFSSAPIVDKRRGSKFTDFLDIIQRTLQDQMSFHVRGDFLPKRPYVTLYTDKKLRPELVRSTDRGIRHRRLAYAVQVNEPVNALISYEIRTILEYQRTAETQWHTERDDTILRAAAEALRTALATNLKP
jgi:hypothetical protein